MVMSRVPERFPQYLAESAEVTIIDCKIPRWKEKIFGALKPPFYPGQQRGEKPLMRILEMVKKELGARTAIIEPYVSTDWNEEYGAIYSRIFQPPPQLAQRIHFFAEPENGKLLEPCDLFQLTEAIQKAYLGHTVVRPLPAFRVGDTVLKSPCAVLHSDGGGKQTFHLSHCTAEFTNSLLGNRLKIKGMPFIQQETTVGVCAEADLWMLARYLNKMSETIRYRPAEITELATRTITVGPPREGLTDEQILAAFRPMGLTGQAFSPKNADEARDFLYTCVESSLPVIAATGGLKGPGHVVVIIGHDYKKKMKFKSPHRSMSELVENFYVHDDAEGPYLRRKVGKVTSIEGVEMLTLGGQRLEVCFVPLPQRVHLLWEDVHNVVDEWLARITAFVAAEFPKLSRGKLWKPWSPGGLVRRIYLRRSIEFKRDLLRGETNERDLDIVAQYRCMQMPRYIWVVELADHKDLDGHNPYSRRIRGEMLLDSTANRHAIDETLLSFHYDGRLYVQGRFNQPSRFLSTDNAKPYRPLLRVTRNDP